MIRSLPFGVIARLKRYKVELKPFSDVSSLLEFPQVLGRMKNVDPRKWFLSSPILLSELGYSSSLRAANIYVPGGRVREMDVRRNFPGVRLVLKYSHGARAQHTLDVVRDKVRVWNSSKEKHCCKPHALAGPFAYAVSDWVIAMRFTRAATVKQLQARRLGYYAKKVKKKLLRKGWTVDAVAHLAMQIEKKTRIEPHNLHVAGLSKNKATGKYELRLTAAPDYL